MNKKNGKKKRIRARALEPYKRVNVCVPLDVYRWFEKNAKPNREQVGALIRRALIAHAELGSESVYESVLMKKMKGLTLGPVPGSLLGPVAGPLLGQKQGKKASKTAKMPDLVK